MNSILEVSELLKSFDNIEIFTHVHPDGDALGSSFALACALRKLGKNARVTCLDTLPSDFEYIYGVSQPEFQGQYTVTVDTADMSLLGDFPHDRRIHLAIDHHNSNRVVCDALYCDPERGACGEIIFDIIKALGVELDRYMAECLYTALATDTGCFKFSNTKKSSFLMAAELCTYAPEGNFGYLNVPLFTTKTPARIKLESEIMGNLEYHFDGKIAVASVTDELLLRLGLSDNETGGVEQLPKVPFGVVLGITLKQRVGGFKVSMRSDDSLDCSKLCAAFGGGGHHSASGCFIEGGAYEVKKKILSYIEEREIL